MKKAQGLSLNVVIIAILGLLVLLIFLGMFVTKSRIFSISAGSCASKGGICYNSCTNYGNNIAKDGAYAPIDGTDCESTEEKCCVKAINYRKEAFS